ncbi:hypothetical protein MRB53_004627 [Persea americana]|uniref:Uncharacterized protein n=1 Tax=Persea americana TaxID=3435 RepID=A0ACC2MAZ4_PERAE|nr:hypothetical protein MRB53_004627 [Persea americana]
MRASAAAFSIFWKEESSDPAIESLKTRLSLWPEIGSYGDFCGVFPAMCESRSDGFRLDRLLRLVSGAGLEVSGELPAVVGRDVWERGGDVSSRVSLV